MFLGRRGACMVTAGSCRGHIQAMGRRHAGTQSANTEAWRIVGRGSALLVPEQLNKGKEGT